METRPYFLDLALDLGFLLAINFNKSPRKGKDNLQIAMLRSSVLSNFQVVVILLRSTL